MRALAVSVQGRSGSLGFPERPPEGPRSAPARDASTGDAADFLELFSTLQHEASHLLGLSADQREMRMLTYLVRCHLKARLVTSSSLAGASGLSYGSAQRAITRMVAQGLIIRRSRTATGKSMSLHPAPDLLAVWHEFAYRANRRMRDALDGAKPSVVSPADYLRLVAPPSVLPEKVGLRGGVRLLSHADPTFAAIGRLKPQFEMILGATLRGRALSTDPLRAEIEDNARRAVSRHDLVAVDFSWFGDMASRGWLMPLDEPIHHPSVSDFHADALETVRWRGAAYGVPVTMSAETLVYRADLLEAAGVAVPRTIEETLLAARTLDDPRRGVSGIVWNGGRGAALGHTFMTTMAAFGRPLLDPRPTRDGFDAAGLDDGPAAPMFASPEARLTLDYLSELIPFSPRNVLEMTGFDSDEFYRKGRSALAYSHSPLGPRHELDPASPTFRRTGHAPLPTGARGTPIAPMRGRALAIPANLAPDRRAGALIALRALTSANANKLCLLNGGLASPRRSVNRDPEIRALSPLAATIDCMAASGLVRMWPRPPARGLHDIIAIAGEEIHDALTGSKSADAALHAAQSRAEAAIRAALGRSAR